MRGTAFGHIDDPADPAWVGYAELAEHTEPRPWTRVIVGACCAVAVVAGFVVMVFAGSGEAGDDDLHGAADRSRPAPIPAAIVAPPADPSLTPIEAVPATPATPAGRAPRRTAKPAPKLSTRPLGSGWAPAAATRGPSTSGRITGDVAGVAPVLVRRLDALAIAMDRDIEVVSGWRRHAEQVDLYERFLSGTGNLAAVPGTSRHETGMAADVYVGGVALANVPGATAAAAALGLHFPVPGEPWHLEMMDAATTR